MKFNYLAVAAVASCFVANASAQLYALSSSTPGTVYQIDQSTGAASAVTNLTGNVLSSITDIEFLNGTAYACDILMPTNWAFGSINLGTGAFTQLNTQAGSANWWGLGANQSLNLLYSVDLNDGTKLKSITPTGTITDIGVTGVSVAGMTYDNNNGILYASDGANLYTINEFTGASTLVGALGVGANNSSDLAYDEVLDALYFTGNGNLYTVNTGTGAATLVGGHGLAGVTIDGLGWLKPVPEPASMAALGLGVLALIRRRKNK